MIEFKLNGNDFIQLCDLLKATNLCENGGQAKFEISSGLVKVNGEVELRKRCKIKIKMIVEYGGEKIIVC